MFVSDFPPVLIVGFKRIKNIENLFRQCIELEIPHIFVHLDGLKNPTEYELLERSRLIETISSIPRACGTQVDILIAPENLGCAISVLNAVSWSLNAVEDVIVLEDDCIPTRDFFEFCKDSRSLLIARDELWLTCGSQFVPRSLTNEDSFVSSYALTWGWFTNRTKWSRILSSLEQLSRSASRRVFLNFCPEETYWFAGALRAMQGHTDVWDTALVCLMRQKGCFALLPAVPLVTNVGNDSVATHTALDQRWTHVIAGKYKGSLCQDRNGPADDWLKKHFYRIRLRHALSAKMTCFLDLFRKPMFERGLVERLRDAPNCYSLGG
jgi:hypothetical protein